MENLNYIISEATTSDAQNILDYLKIVGGETDNLSFDSEGITASLEEEIEILEKYQKLKNGVFLLAKINNEIISCATAFQFLNNKKQTHVFKFAISVKKKFWGNKIANKMIDELLNLAKERGCTKMILYVNTANISAISLYLKKGFEIEGKLKNNIKSKDIYLDDYLMSKDL